MPVFDFIPASFVRSNNSKERLYRACGRTRRYLLGTVSKLWLNTSGGVSNTICNVSQSPLKSGIKDSMVTLAIVARSAVWVAAKMGAPPSFLSSRLMEVSTTCFNFILAAASATRLGSSQSKSAGGLPVLTAQNAHERVQTSPSNINVAVPAPQHSPIFGHLASEHTVFNLCSLIVSRTSLNFSPDGSFTRNQSGRRCFDFFSTI